ncbi:histidine phosphatase family protein [Pseudolysinimonas yzui]|uniref:histidine phosphatase family protein n=1 Tax=Pseudolysinimonas yzui TaxID=2708254 RepID=UPI0017496078|nr:histidine phosphatase family protein [Pseudolysinimonas yzui]
MRILFVRHGQTPANVRGILDTAAPGPGLTELGTRQAHAVVEALGHESIAAIYVSKLLRTHETAAPLAAALGLTPVELDGTHEIEAGDVEGRSDHDAVRTYMTTVFAWGSGDPSPVMPGGPDGHAFFARFDGAIAQVAAEHPVDATVVVVSHGAAIRVWTGARVRNLGDGFTADNHLDNTGIVVVDGSPEAGWTALSWGGVPVGGAQLADPTADDPTGDALDEALDDPRDR